MELKIKIKKGNYALRTYDESNRQIYYTSYRLDGFKYDNDYLKCEIPDESKTYELKETTTLKIVASGKIGELNNGNESGKNLQNKPADLQVKK